MIKVKNKDFYIFKKLFVWEAAKKKILNGRAIKRGGGWGRPIKEKINCYLKIKYVFFRRHIKISIPAMLAKL